MSTKDADHKARVELAVNGFAELFRRTFLEHRPELAPFACHIGAAVIHALISDAKYGVLVIGEDDETDSNKQRVDLFAIHADTETVAELLSGALDALESADDESAPPALH